MELKETYYDNGRGKRIYRVDPTTGTEYLYYFDKREKVIIRAALPDDAANICKTMMTMMQLIALKSKKPIEQVLKEQTERIRRQIEDYEQDDTDMVWVFEKNSRKPNKYIGFGETTSIGANSAEAKLLMHFVSAEAKRLYERRLHRALANACEKHAIYDKLTLVDESGSHVKKVIYPQ